MKRHLLALSLAAVMMFGAVFANGQTVFAEEYPYVPCIESEEGTFPIMPFCFLPNESDKKP